MSVRVVFVGGIHGVGKSTLCERIALQTGALHVKASHLIRQEDSGAAPLDTKLVQDVEANQRRLVTAFERVRATCTEAAVLLDGHYVLSKRDMCTERIPTEVFAALGTSSLICLRDVPNKIAARLQARDGRSPSESELSALQDVELEHAANVARALELRLSVISAFDQDAAVKVLAAF
jgi:adenylate kinase